MTMILSSILFIIITACGVAIVAKLMQFVNAKIDANQTKIKNETLNMLIDQAQDIITTAVASVSQTYVSTLKKEGKFNGVAAQNAKEQAILIIKDLLSEQVNDALSQVYGDIDEYISHAIEKQVRWTRY